MSDWDRTQLTASQVAELQYMIELLLAVELP